MQSKIMVIATLLVLFISQSFAYDSMSCQMMNSDTHNQSMTLVDHEMPMYHGAMNEEMKDCCGEDCACPPGTCASYALAPISLSSSPNLGNFDTAPYRFSVTEIEPTLRKRPPISA